MQADWTGAVAEIVSLVTGNPYWSGAFQDIISGKLTVGDGYLLNRNTTKTMLLPYMWDMALTKHGNHFSQKMVCIDPSCAELRSLVKGTSRDKIGKVATSIFGCRVVNRMLERGVFTQEQVLWLAESAPRLLVAESGVCCSGKYVVLALAELFPCICITIAEKVYSGELTVTRNNQAVVARMFELACERPQEEADQRARQILERISRWGHLPQVFHKVLRKKGLTAGRVPTAASALAAQ